MAGKSPILSVKILADAKGFTAGLDQAEGKLAGFGKKLAGAFAAIGVGAFVADAIKGAEAAQQANAKIGQILETNVGATQAKIDATVKSAEALSKSIAVDDEVIKAGQAILGTFKSVAKSAGETGGVFERATVAAADLASAGFGSIESNSVALGKALENPTKGLTALSKSGVTFTDSQRDMIKALQESGDMAGAQAIVLKAIEDQVGGTAEASVTASQRMAYSWGELSEGIGGLLLPLFEKVAGFITDKVIPAVQGFVDFIGSGDLSGLAEAFNVDPSSLNWLTEIRDKVVEFGGYITGTVVPAVQGFVETLWDWRDVLIPIAAGVGAMVAAFQIYQGVLAAVRIATGLWTAAQLILNTVLSANPVGLVILAIGALIAIGVALWRNWDTITEKLGAAWDWIKEKTSAIWDDIKEFLSNAWEKIKSTATDAWEKLRTVVVEKAQAVVDWMREFPGKLVTAVGNLASTLLQKGKDIILGFIEGYVGAYVAVGEWFLGLGGKIARAVGSLASTLLGKGQDVIDGLKEGVEDRWTGLKTWFEGIPGKVKNAIGDLGKTLFSKGKDLLQGFIDGVKSIAGNLPGFIKDAIGIGNWSVVPDISMAMPSARRGYRLSAASATMPVVNLVRVNIAGREVRAVISDEAEFFREITARDQLLERLVGVA